ncbi:G-box-binding factor 3-like isoform X2 [Telopea speciosissima]|uniref:G-box-binding factor 3-like isoform X2 n=1 Tax=Telopea speciosissima TaxID=54955 RepID=UPI001CC340BB|nr:G-box-binding factor 3-like isoform X2 [Telopea speciosissima]
MGNNEADTPSKSEKASSPAQTNVHPCPEWANIQAYYGPGVTLPPPYFNSAVTTGHAPPPYMWGPPQPLMPPYGVPYAIYSHGGVYAHPAVPYGSHGHGIPPSPVVSEVMVATPFGVEPPAKSSTSKERGLMKKLKGFDGLAVSIGNDNAENALGGAIHRMSQRFVTQLLFISRNWNILGLLVSWECNNLCILCPVPYTCGESGTEGSSDGSDGNTGGDKSHRKRNCESTPSTGKDGKFDPAPVGEANVTPGSTMGAAMAPVSVQGISVGTDPLASMISGLELTASPNGNVKPNSGTVPPSPGVVVPARDGLPSELWIQDERELKRERRKQSNRESARRSRLRKQAETEELAVTVETLSAENIALRSELNQLTENSQKLRLENAALMEKLKDAHLEVAEDMAPNNMESETAPPDSTVNLLSRVNNLGSVRSEQRDSEPHENSNSSTKFHQLLESSPRADAIAAG